MNNGYEYMVVGHCKRTGKAFMRPIAWNHPTKPTPTYPTCTCCSKKEKD